jgi:hypothetical protein
MFAANIKRAHCVDPPLSILGSDAKEEIRLDTTLLCRPGAMGLLTSAAVDHDDPSVLSIILSGAPGRIEMGTGSWSSPAGNRADKRTGFLQGL